MARQVVNVGSALADRTGDNGRVAFQKVNDNFSELYVQHDITAAETAAGVTPVNFGYPPGDVRRYGDNTTPGTTDMTAAVTNALAANDYVWLQPDQTYALANVAIPVGKILDLNGATVQPLTGATSIFTVTGAGFDTQIKNGTLTDTVNVCRVSTTLAAGIASGATSITVASAAGLENQELICIVADDTDGGSKRKLHHTRIDSIAGTTLTLKDAFPFTAAALGNAVLTSRGLIRIDGSNDYKLTDLIFQTVNLGIVLRGVSIGAIASGKGTLKGLRFRTFSLGAIDVGHDVRIMHYEDIVGFGNSPDAWRSGFGWRIDDRGSSTGDDGDHGLVGVNFLSLQDGFYLASGSFVFFTNTVADNCYRYGTRLENGSEAYFGLHWSSFNQINLSIVGSSVATAAVLRTRNTAAFSAAYDIEVQDASSLYINYPTWYGTRLLRNEAGWSSANVRYEIGHGTAAAPGLSFFSDTDTGFYRVSADILGVAAGGAFVASFAPGQLRTVDGTAAAPAHTFNNDQDTGLYRISADLVGIAAGGSLVAQFGGGQVRVPVGTAGTPGYSFTGDVNTGLYGIGGDNVGLALGGTLNVDFAPSRTRFAVPIHFAPGASVTPANNGDVTFELTNNTTLTVKARGSDGVVRSGTITLA